MTPEETKIRRDALDAIYVHLSHAYDILFFRERDEKLKALLTELISTLNLARLNAQR